MSETKNHTKFRIEPKKIKKYESIKNNPGQNDYNDLLEMIKTELEMLDNSQNKGTLYSVLQREGDFYEKKLRRSNERSFEEERTDYSREAGSSFSNEMEERRSIYNSNEISDPAGHRVSHTHAGRNNGIGSEYEAYGASADLQGQQYSGNSVGQEELSETGKINDSTRNADNGLQNLSEGRVEVHTDEPDVSTGEHGDGLIVLTEEAAAELVKNDNQKMNFVQEKLAAAGIEVVKDKAEFERILNNVEILQKMTEENSVEDLFVSANDKNLDSEIDKLTVNDIHLKNDFIEISKETPFILRQCGLDNYPVCMYKQKLARALFLEKEEFGERRTHGHKGEFTDKDVKEVFSNLGNPRYVFNSTKNNNIPDDFYVIGVYDQFDKNNNPMMVSFHFNKNTKEVEANWVTAVYGRNKIDIMKNWVEKGYLLYINDLEIEKASAEVGTLYMRVIHNANAYSKKIIRKSDFVNNLDMLFYKLHNQTYGFAHNGKIYLNPEIANSEVAIHEYTHLWDSYIQRTNSNLWEIGKNLFKNTHYWNDVKADPNYADIADNDDLLLSEVHAQLVGKMAEEVLNKIIERDGELTKDSVIDWDKECWAYLENTLWFELEHNFSPEELHDFLAMPMKDFMNGVRITEFENEKTYKIGGIYYTQKQIEEDQPSGQNISVQPVEPEYKKMKFVLEKLAADGIEVVKDKSEFERILEREKILQKMSGTLTAEEQRRYFTFDEEDTRRFIERVDEWQKQKTSSKNYNPGKLIEVGKIPPIMKVLGIADKPIEIQYYTISKILRENPLYPNDKQGHKLTIDDIYAIPSQLADPVMVFKSRTRADSFVFFTERKDSENHSILIPLAVNKQKGRIVINEITSMYGKDNEIDFVMDNIIEGNLIYADKKRSLEWERECKVQFLTQGLPPQGSTSNILTKDRLVNFISSQNAPVQTMVQNGNTYGFTHDGKIYLNPDVMNSEVAIHEYTHLWDNYIQRTNSNLWEIGKNIFKNTHYWNDVKADPNYADIADNDDLLLSEVHAQLVGKMADEILNKIVERDGELTKDSVIDWDKECWLWLSNEIAGVELEESEVNQRFKNMTSFLSMTMKDFMSGKNISIPKEQSVTKEPVQLTSKKDIKAIREQCREILQKPDSDITEEDKAILAQYEGAGGIKENDRSASGILNEFYTPNNLVEKVWQLVDSYAPNAKTVLEPSAGVGKFANNRPNNEFTMHELDETSARINKILHPDANIIQGAYQKQFFDAGGRIHIPGQKAKYDIVIGNPPYGAYNDKYKGLGEGKEFDRYEEYFISKGLDALKDENSVMAFVVPSGFLNSASDKQKEIIASKGKLIDAYRLPVGTFPTTEVGTDIIIMQNWAKERNNPKYTDEIFKDVIERQIYDLSENHYFSIHPEKILGEVKTRTNRFGKEEEYVAVHEGLTVQDELNKIAPKVQKVERNVLVENKKAGNLSPLITQRETDFNNTVAAVGVAPTIQTLRTRVSSTALRASTTTATQSIPQEAGKSSSTHSDEIIAEAMDDPSKRLYDDPDGLFETPKILSMQEFSKFYTGNNFDEKDYNIWANTDYRGIVNTASLSAEEKEYLKTSGKYVEPEPGIYTNAMLYATGKIYEKLDELEKQKKNLSSESYEKCKAILEKAVPELYPMSKIQMDVLSPLAEEFTVTRTVTRKQWDYGAIKNVTSDENLNLKEDFLSWCTGYLQPDSENTRTYIQDFSVANVSREEIPENISFNDVAAYVDRIPVNTGVNEDDTKEQKNAKLTVAGAKKDARKETAYKLFNRYLQTGLSQEEKDRFCLYWNKIYNGTVQADYKKLPLFIDGMSTFKGNSSFKLYKQQIEGISRLVSKGNGLLAYGVGVGKTAAGIGATVAQLQSKRSKRPLIIVPNQVYKKWVRDLRELFPNVAINELGNLSDPFLEANHYDESTHSLIIPENSVSVMTDSALQKITFTDEACDKYLAKDFGCVLGLSSELEGGDDRERANALQKIQNLVGRASRIKTVKVPGDEIARETEIQQSYVFFDRCNFDNVCVDEAHNYKNLFVVPRAKKGDKKQANEFEGIGSASQSRRALKMFGITTIIQQQNDNRNVFLLTATPFTNNPLEVYSMLSFMARKELLDRHIYDVRDFCTEFALTKTEYAVTPDGDIKPKNVMKAFKGQKKLYSLITEFIDSKSAEDAGIPKPEGERHAVYLELTDLQQQIINYNEAAIKTASGKDGVVLKAMTHMRTATLSPALLDPEDYPGLEIPPLEKVVEASPKLKYVCDTVADVYKFKPECGQFIYMPQGVESFQYVKEYLVKQGVPEEAIEYVSGKHNNTNEKKQKVADRFNDKEDKLKILIGSSNVAEGIDLNGNSICCYNTMLGWNPTESVQVEGRIWRQGNEQGKVHIYYPLMEDSIDALIYQKHDEKASRINSIFKEYENDQDTIDVSEIDPETVKFELIKDPVKKVDMLIEQDTAEFKKELKILENRTETINDLVKAYGIIKNMIAEQKSEHEKYSELVKQYRENLKNIPENDYTRWQHEGRLESAVHTRDVAYKELQKGNARMNSIMTNFMRMDIKIPETEAAIKLEEIARKKQAVQEKIESIEKSKDKRIEEEQIKLLQKKLVAKPLEQQRKETVEYILKNTWYKTTEEKVEAEKPVVKDASITTEPLPSIPIKVEEKIEEPAQKAPEKSESSYDSTITEEERKSYDSYVQQELFDFDDINQTKVLNIGEYKLSFDPKFVSANKGLLPVLKESEGVYKILCKGKDLLSVSTADNVYIHDSDDVEIAITKEKLQEVAKKFIQEQIVENIKTEYEDANFKRKKIVVPKLSKMSYAQKELYLKNGITDEKEMLSLYKESYKDIMLSGEKPVLVAKKQEKPEASHESNVEIKETTYVINDDMGY
ncbi:MAG: Eco57I restriction-modification methylase domain-containing protein [Spirochaetia bacterium]|nr:Eco57I restriction-modification methylase domain-containing protein [Spirochaetia bacterium]